MVIVGAWATLESGRRSSSVQLSLEQRGSLLCVVFSAHPPHYLSFTLGVEMVSVFSSCCCANRYFFQGRVHFSFQVSFVSLSIRANSLVWLRHRVIWAEMAWHILHTHLADVTDDCLKQTVYGNTEEVQDTNVMAGTMLLWILGITHPHTLRTGLLQDTQDACDRNGWLINKVDIMIRCLPIICKQHLTTWLHFSMWGVLPYVLPPGCAGMLLGTSGKIHAQENLFAGNQWYTIFAGNSFNNSMSMALYVEEVVENFPYKPQVFGCGGMCHCK